MKMNETSHGKIKFANNSSLSTVGTGRVMLRNNEGREVVVDEVLYIPGLKTNLLSLG